MKNPKMFEWRSAKNRIVRRLTAEDLKVYRLTPALENAGYRVPPLVLIREGYVQKRVRQVIEDENAERAAKAMEKAARQLRAAAEGLTAAAEETPHEGL